MNSRSKFYLDLLYQQEITADKFVIKYIFFFMTPIFLAIFVITPGVQSVVIDMEKGEIKAKGNFDPIKVHKRIQKLSKMKIELISPKVQVKETEKKVIKETKQVINTTFKLFL